MPGWPDHDGNDTYLGKTLRYGDVELGFDESVNGGAVLRLWLRAFIVSFTVWAVFAFFAAVSGISSLSDSMSGEPGGGGGAAGVLFGFGSVLGFVAFWVILLATKLPEPIAEWRVLLLNRGNKADSVYSHISGTLRERQLPVGFGVRRIRTGLGRDSVSNRLVLRDRSYTAYVSVFAYGTSLYLSWTMWRRRRGAALVKQFLVDIVEGMAGTRDPERAMMRTERPRAMREAVHAACREGLFAAQRGVEVPMEFGFPRGLPQIEAEQLGPAPLPMAPGGAHAQERANRA